MRRRLILAIQTVLLSGLTTGCFAPTSPDGEDATSARTSESAKCLTPEEAEAMADQVLQLVNLERAERNLPPIKTAPSLRRIAEGYACRMVTEGFFGHRDPFTGHGPGERMVAGKYHFFSVGENLAAGAKSPAEVMTLWMDSPAHRNIILDPIWKEMGIGVRSGGRYSMYWVQEFGDPAMLDRSPDDE